MPCWWGLMRPKQLSMAATARVIWLCACARYWPDCGLVLSVSLAFIVVFPQQWAGLPGLHISGSTQPSFGYGNKSNPGFKSVFSERTLYWCHLPLLNKKLHLFNNGYCHGPVLRGRNDYRHNYISGRILIYDVELYILSIALLLLSYCPCAWNLNWPNRIQQTGKLH